ncbi:MAG: transcriptional regulator [Gemmatimonadota bacterium]
MERKLFQELLESANEALAHAKGKRDLRTSILPPPPKPMGSRDVRRLRERLDASQTMFAGYLNVSTKLVQAWEADRRTPEGAALRLLRLAEQAPELLLSGTTSATRKKDLSNSRKASASSRRSAKRKTA